MMTAQHSWKVGFARHAKLEGQRFGRWTVVSYAGRNKNRAGTWLCRCDCGKDGIVTAGTLRNGQSQSCGCYHLERIASKGGISRHPLYALWNSMHARCYKPRATSYPRYGAKGIRVCERWHDFANFLADMGERPGGASLERKDGAKNYEPGNVVWATGKQQARNRRTSLMVMFLGETKPLAEWCEQLGLDYHKTWKAIRKHGVLAAVALQRNT